jgi:hypothetical protein
MFCETEFEELLKTYDIITSKKLKYDYSYFDGFADAHNIHDLIETGNVIKEKYPEYYDEFERLVHSNESYFGNIMVTSSALFDEYASWLFDLFFEVQKRIDVSSYDDYHKRVFGLISEFLLMVWVSVRKLKAYECMVGMTEEKYETKEMKLKLADYFKKRDIQAAKTYFLESLRKRPDVLMQASDTTGELKLAMQVITTCDNENKNNLRSVVEGCNEFSDLMVYFRSLNEVISRYRLHKNLKQDIDYLQSHKISYIAIEIAVMILCTDPECSANTIIQIASDYEKAGNKKMEVQLLNDYLTYDPGNETVCNRLNEILA